jgi:hypothetical protein
MMQRDEDALLEPWLAYHGALFGFDNLFVFDNGSTSPHVRAVIDRYRRRGVNFDTRWSDPKYFERKHRILIAKIDELRRGGAHDLYIPMDADEFLVHFDRDGLTCDRAAILAYLAGLAGERDVLRIRTLLYNIPGHPDRYYAADLSKVFFAQGDVVELSHGLHFGATDLSDQYRDVDVTYLHFHNKPFAELLRSARRKLESRVDVDSPEALRAYVGHGDHLTRYFSMTERDYVASFAGLDYVAFPPFRQALDRLGLAGNIDRVLRAAGPPADLGRALPAAIDPDAYWRANPDVREAGVRPLLHYYCHGAREGRDLA